MSSYSEISLKTEEKVYKLVIFYLQGRLIFSFHFWKHATSIYTKKNSLSYTIIKLKIFQEKIPVDLIVSTKYL